MSEKEKARGEISGKGGGPSRRSHAGKRKCERNGKTKKSLQNKEKSSEKRLTDAGKEANIAVGICPFYLQDRGNGRVNCEGASLKFPDKEARREFVYRLCAHPDGYKECRLRVALEHYYERKYEEHE